MNPVIYLWLLSIAAAFRSDSGNDSESLTVSSLLYFKLLHDGSGTLKMSRSKRQLFNDHMRIFIGDSGHITVATKSFRAQLFDEDRELVRSWTAAEGQHPVPAKEGRFLLVAWTTRGVLDAHEYFLIQSSERMREAAVGYMSGLFKPKGNMVLLKICREEEFVELSI